MLSAVDFGAHGGHTLPPHLLFRRLSATPPPLALGPIDAGFDKRGGARNKLRVGNFLTFSGSPGIWGPASTNSVLLAVSELNRQGGILGREIELSMYDSGGPIEQVAERAAQAVAFDEVDVIMGSHISAVRVALRKVTRNRIPYVYTPVYEGGERTPGVMAIGETPGTQWRPSIEWLADTRRASLRPGGWAETRTSSVFRVWKVSREASPGRRPSFLECSSPQPTPMARTSNRK